MGTSRPPPPPPHPTMTRTGNLPFYWQHYLPIFFLIYLANPIFVVTPLWHWLPVPKLRPLSAPPFPDADAWLYSFISLFSHIIYTHTLGDLWYVISKWPIGILYLLITVTLQDQASTYLSPPSWQQNPRMSAVFCAGWSSPLSPYYTAVRSLPTSLAAFLPVHLSTQNLWVFSLSCPWFTVFFCGEVTSYWSKQGMAASPCLSYVRHVTSYNVMWRPLTFRLENKGTRPLGNTCSIWIVVFHDFSPFYHY